MFSGRAHVGIDGGLQTAINERTSAESTGFAVFPSRVEVFQRWTDVGESLEDVFSPFKTRKCWNVTECEIYFRCRALEFVVRDRS